MPWQPSASTCAACCHGWEDVTWASAEPAQSIHLCASNMAGTATFITLVQEWTLLALFRLKLFLTKCRKYSFTQCVSLQVSMAVAHISPEIKKNQKPPASPPDRSRTGKSKSVKDVRLLDELVSSMCSLVVTCDWPAWKNNSVKHLFTVRADFYF